MTVLVMAASGEAGGGRRSTRPATTAPFSRTDRGSGRPFARRLAQLESSSIRVLLDVRSPQTGGGFQHLVVTAGGVWTITAASAGEGRPERMLVRRPFRRSAERLRIGDRDRSDLVDSVQQRMVRLSERLGDVPVRGALCLVGGDWPLTVRAFTVGGVEVTWSRRMIERIRADDAGDVDVDTLAWRLSAGSVGPEGFGAEAAQSGSSGSTGAWWSSPATPRRQ